MDTAGIWCCYQFALGHLCVGFGELYPQGLWFLWIKANTLDRKKRERCIQAPEASSAVRLFHKRLQQRNTAELWGSDTFTNQVAKDSALRWVGNKTHVFTGCAVGQDLQQTEQGQPPRQRKGTSSLYSRSIHSSLLPLLPGCQRSQTQQAGRKREQPCISPSLHLHPALA